jgi:hypothetical protein
MKRFRLSACITAVFAIALSAVTAARFLGPPEFDLSWNTIDGGGGTSTDIASGFELSGTIGQPDAGGPMVGGGFELVGGFWPGAGPEPVDTCPADIAPSPNGNGIVNVDDLLAIISAWGPCASGDCPADLNGDLMVNVDDLLAVINAWGTCP